MVAIILSNEWVIPPTWTVKFLLFKDLSEICLMYTYYYNIFFMMSHDPFQFLQTNIVCKDVKNTMKTNLYII